MKDYKAIDEQRTVHGQAQGRYEMLVGDLTRDEAIARLQTEAKAAFTEGYREVARMLIWDIIFLRGIKA